MKPVQKIDISTEQRHAPHDYWQCGVRYRAMCAAVDCAKLGALDKIVVHSHYAPHQAIFEEGGHADYVYNVTNGNIRLYKLPADGRRQITGFLIPGDFLGLVIQDTYAYSAEAIDNVELCCMRVINLERLMTEMPAVRDRLLEMGRDELMAAQEQMLLLGRKSAKEKLLSFLLLRLGEEGRSDSRQPVMLDLPMTRRDIGDYIGLSLETVSRTFSELRKEGLIELPLANHLIIPDLEKIEEAVNA